MKKLKIAYISYFDSDIIHSWSGLIYFVRKSLELDNTEIIPIHNLASKFDDIYKVKSLYYKLIKKNYHRLREESINKRIALKIEKALKIRKPDVIVSCGSLELAYVESKIPMTFWSDATFHCLVDYYPSHTNLARETIVTGDKLERISMGKSQKQIFGSDWASEDSINYYKSDPKKVQTIPFGANIIESPTLDEIRILVQNKDKKICKLLFLGVEWYRKGGDIALKITEKLNESGIKAELHVVGCSPEIENKKDYIKIHGYLNKRNKDDYEKFINLLKESHFMILPTRAEFYGIVFCEANAYGLPAIGSNTGGVPTIIKDGINGIKYKLEIDDTERVAEFIRENFINQEKYKNLAESSFNEYISRLNWDVFSKTYLNNINEII